MGGSKESTALLRIASIRRHAPWTNPKSTECGAVLGKIESFTLDSSNFVQPSRQLLAIDGR
jgi:hypothetical protein